MTGRREGDFMDITLIDVILLMNLQQEHFAGHVCLCVAFYPLQVLQK
jgi:hypothetical protein